MSRSVSSGSVLSGSVRSGDGGDSGASGDGGEGGSPVHDRVVSSPLSPRDNVKGIGPTKYTYCASGLLSFACAAHKRASGRASRAGHTAMRSQRHMT